eukprot:15381921-Alexandrium_andersonii.AAC.1
MMNSAVAAVLVMNAQGAPAGTPDPARVSLASTATEESQITGRLPSLTGALGEDAQRSPDP